MVRLRAALLAASLISLAACSTTGESPTALRDGATSIRRDGTGYGLGSGNKNDSTQTNSAGAQNQTSADGGYGLGSGN